MRLFLLAIVLLLSLAATAIGADYANGTVVVWENGTYLNVIQRRTGSNKTHTAIILYEGKQAWVYEASKPDVHRYRINEYVRRIDAFHKKMPDLGVYFLEPQTPYTYVQLARMKQAADSQLNRPFSVRSYVLGRRLNTVHCCEYVGDVLSQSGRFRTIGPKESPKTIFDKASKL